MYKLISDSGHAWLEVKEQEVRESGIAISEFSYIDRERHLMYLEEDEDARAFIETKGLTAADISERHFNNECFIRMLEHVRT